MILADSSVWIDHFRLANLTFARMLRDRRVAMHPFVIGEIALGSLKDRDGVIAEFAKLPPIDVCAREEVMMLIKRTRLHGRGIGYVDAHLLAATLMTPGTYLWTRDKRLHAAAEESGVAARVAD